MKYANFNGIKTHAKDAKSGAIGSDLWFEAYKVVACVGKYRQYWKYDGEKPILPNGYEPETEWHANWKMGIIDDACEVICGDNREHRADIKTDKYVIEIQKSPIDGWAVMERNEFYSNLTGARLIWIVNAEKPWKDKHITMERVPNEEDGRFFIKWKYKWKWVNDMSITTKTHLYLDVNPKMDKMLMMWDHKDWKTGKFITYCKWIMKESFFRNFLLPVAKDDFINDPKKILGLFH
jgi:hypothetical protein